MINPSLFLAVLFLSSPVLAAEDRREVPLHVMDTNRDYFAKLFHETYGKDAEGTTYVSCTSTDKSIGLTDFYLFRPRPPAAPVLVEFYRNKFLIGNLGTVRYHEKQVDMWPGHGGNGTAELQRIVVEPLLEEPFLPAGDIADVFLIAPAKKCAFAESKFFGRPAVPAPK